MDIVKRCFFSGVVIAIGACDAGAADPLLVGQWRFLDAEDGTIEFSAGGDLLGVEGARRETGSFEVIGPGQLQATVEGDSFIMDYRIVGDTLIYSVTGDDGVTRTRAVRVR